MLCKESLSGATNCVRTSNGSAEEHFDKVAVIRKVNDVTQKFQNQLVNFFHILTVCNFCATSLALLIHWLC